MGHWFSHAFLKKKCESLQKSVETLIFTCSFRRKCVFLFFISNQSNCVFRGKEPLIFAHQTLLCGCVKYSLKPSEDLRFLLLQTSLQGPMLLLWSRKISIAPLNRGANATPPRPRIKISFVVGELAWTYKSSPEQMILFMSQFGRCSCYAARPPRSRSFNVFRRRSQGCGVARSVWAQWRGRGAARPRQEAHWARRGGAPLRGTASTRAQITLSSFRHLLLNQQSAHKLYSTDLFDFNCSFVHFEVRIGILIPLQGTSPWRLCYFGKKIRKSVFTQEKSFSKFNCSKATRNTKTPQVWRSCEYRSLHVCCQGMSPHRQKMLQGLCVCTHFALRCEQGAPKKTSLELVFPTSTSQL